jgi:hypothetical protein
MVASTVQFIRRLWKLSNWQTGHILTNRSSKSWVECLEDNPDEYQDTHSFVVAGVRFLLTRAPTSTVIVIKQHPDSSLLQFMFAWHELCWLWRSRGKELPQPIHITLGTRVYKNKVVDLGRYGAHSLEWHVDRTASGYRDQFLFGSIDLKRQEDLTLMWDEGERKRLE